MGVTNFKVRFVASTSYALEEVEVDDVSIESN
jgi:hypothetical protein